MYANPYHLIQVEEFIQEHITPLLEQYSTLLTVENVDSVNV